MRMSITASTIGALPYFLLEVAIDALSVRGNRESCQRVHLDAMEPTRSHREGDLGLHVPESAEPVAFLEGPRGDGDVPDPAVEVGESPHPAADWLPPGPPPKRPSEAHRTYNRPCEDTCEWES